MSRAANVYTTVGPEADAVADLIAELYAGDAGGLAYAMLQPNPRLWQADELDDLADGLAGEEQERFRAAAAYLRREPVEPHLLEGYLPCPEHGVHSFPSKPCYACGWRPT